MTLELSLLDLADFDCWHSEKVAMLLVLGPEEFDSFEPLQQVALEDS